MESLSLWYAFEESGGNLIKDFSKGQIDGNLINGGRITANLDNPFFSSGRLCYNQWRISIFKHFDDSFSVG